MATRSGQWCSSLEQVPGGVFEVNYFGPLRLCRAVLPGMRKRRSGLLVHMSSIGGRATVPNSAYYCATKTGLEALGESQRYELASFGIDVVLIEPGAFGTESFDKAMYQDDRERAAEYGPLAHKGEQGPRAFHHGLLGLRAGNGVERGRGGTPGPSCPLARACRFDRRYDDRDGQDS